MTSQFPENAVETVRQMYAAGSTQEQIGEVLGRNKVYVHRLMKAHGIAVRSPLKLPKPGDKFGRLTFLKVDSARPRRAGSNAKRFYCLAACECGTEKVFQLDNMRSGATTSCGCYLKETISKANKKPDNYSAVTIIMASYQREALRRCLEWGLTREQFGQLLFLPCHYCGTVGSNCRTASLTEPLRYNGVDRADNTLGYLPSNVVPCCHQCNRAKLTMNVAEFVSWARQIVRHQDKTGDGK